MNLQELHSRLETTGMPVTYRKWAENAAPPLPNICYLVSNSNNFAADGKVYYRTNRVQVELYTKCKDLEAEAKVESALDSLYWEKTETYIEGEKCYQILYEIEV